MATNALTSHRLPTWHLLLLALGLFTACGQAFDDNVLPENLSHIRFEFKNPALNPNDPTNIPLDTFSVVQGGADSIFVPIVLSGQSPDQQVELSLLVSGSANFVPNEQVLLKNIDGTPSNLFLSIAPGTFQTGIWLVWQDLPAQQGFLQLQLDSVSPAGLGLGLPGPRAQRRSFTLIVQSN